MPRAVTHSAVPEDHWTRIAHWHWQLAGSRAGRGGPQQNQRVQTGGGDGPALGTDSPAKLSFERGAGTLKQTHWQAGTSSTSLSVSAAAATVSPAGPGADPWLAVRVPAEALPGRPAGGALGGRVPGGRRGLGTWKLRLLRLRPRPDSNHRGTDADTKPGSVQARTVAEC